MIVYGWIILSINNTCHWNENRRLLIYMIYIKKQQQQQQHNWVNNRSDYDEYMQACDKKASRYKINKEYRYWSVEIKLILTKCT